MQISFKYIILFGFVLHMSIFAEPFTIITEDIPAQTRQLDAKFASVTALQGMIKTLSTAQNVQTQIDTLKHLQDFQNNPSNAVSQANSLVTGLLNNLNSTASYDSGRINNLSQLIGQLSSSSSSEGMNVRLMSAANMQLISMQNILQQIQAQQQALIAYKQAEITEQTSKEEQSKRNQNATVTAMRGY